MTRRTARVLSVLAWVQWAFFMACITAAMRLLALTHRHSSGSNVIVVAFFFYSTFGAFVASRRPDNVIGWLFTAIGLGTGITSLSAGYLAYAELVTRNVTAPSVQAITLLGNCVWDANLACGAFILLLFPDGRVPGRRWQAVGWLLGGTLAIMEISIVFMPGQFEGDPVTNPLGIPGAGPLLSLLSGVSKYLFIVLALLAVLSVVQRFWRSTGEQRQQLKWFAYAAALMALCIAGTVVLLPETGSGATVGFMVAFLTLPLGAGIAVLKYRLYDIDVLINRTIVYGMLTASLALIYFGSVIGLQYALRTFTQGSSLAVVISTLVIAALFQPLRWRLQRIIDRRFYRRKYDAARTLASFSTTLRGEVDLAQLSEHLVAVVRETMQPAHVSLWLRAPERDTGQRLGGRP